MSVGKICTRLVATAGPEDTIRECARRMGRHNVGTLVVLDAAGKPRGMVTDRDLVSRCVAANEDPEFATVESVMTRPIRTVSEGTSIEHAVALMDRQRIRRLVVTDVTGRLAGVVSVDDVILLLATEAAQIGGILAQESPSLIDA